MQLRQLPNLITLLRIALIVPIALSLAQRRFGATLLLFALAGLSDGLDGFLAKRFGWQTQLGALLDPIADKLLLATVFVTLALLGSVPPWLMAAAVGRDLLIVTGTVAYRLLIGPVEFRPTLISKFNTVCQLLFILIVVAREQFAAMPPWVVTLGGALMLVTVVVSGLDYVLTYAGRALGESRARRAEAPLRADASP